MKIRKKVSDLMISDLMNIYPESLLNPEKSELPKLENYYIVEENSDTLYILLDRLNQQEIALLKILASKQGFHAHETSRLDQMLTKGIIEDSLAGQQGRLVYLQVNHLEPANFSLWKNTLQDSVKELIEVQMMSGELIVILLSGIRDERKIITKLQDVIQSLDQDFNLFTQGMIGQASHLSRQIKDIYLYERELFESFIKKQRVEGITTISEVLMYQMSLLLKDEQPQLPQLKNYLANKAEARDLVLLLFKNQGNLSQTADELFIHRNTLTYRMKQFYEQTGFDLSNFSDLIVCHLLIV